MIVIDKLNDTLTAAAEVVIFSLTIIGIALTVTYLCSKLRTVFKLDQETISAVSVPYAHCTTVIPVLITAYSGSCYGIDL